MPIFEYLCRSCNTIYSFLSMSPQPAREPLCPKCGGGGLQRVPSAFAVRSKSPKAGQAGATDGDAAAGMDAEAMEMLGSLDERDASDPRTMARMMRRLAETSGEEITPTMEEMFRRLEAGEDPDTVETELGDQLEAEMEGETGEGGPAPSRDGGLYSF